MNYDKRKKISDIKLPTEESRQQVLEIFELLAVEKRDKQSFFLLAEIYYVLKQVWEGPDQPTMDDMEHYLDDACITYPATYRKNKDGAFRYIMRRDD